MRIIGGLLIAGLGVAIIAYAASLSKALWRWEWAEHHLGGTMQWYVIIGFIVIILGVLTMFGWSVVKPDPTGLQLHQ